MKYHQIYLPRALVSVSLVLIVFSVVVMAGDVELSVLFELVAFAVLLILMMGSIVTLSDVFGDNCICN